MGLLWALMGASKGYNIFAGGAEMLGGILLFVPQLAMLGALISVGVIANIFALNMAYDTPVKLYSFHLLIMAVIIALPDTRRLANVFLFNRKADPPRLRPCSSASSFGTEYWRCNLFLVCIAYLPLCTNRTLR